MIISSNIEKSGIWGYQTSDTDAEVIVLQGVVVAGFPAILATANGATVFNQGSLFGDGVGIDFDNNSTAGAYVNNTLTGFISGANGGILGSNTADSVTNAGYIDGGNFGITLTGDNSRISNTGTVNSANGIGLNNQGKTPFIQNTGSVHAYTTGIAEVVTAGSSGLVVNSGTVTSGAYAAAFGGGGSVTFRNSGSLDGDIIVLQTATLTYDGRKGTLNGTANGGTGADRMFAGDDGERLAGGAGHDRLVGGAGADTFLFSSFSSADSDVIRQFDVAKDLIQFDSTVFTHLRADTTPLFAIGTAATSATDFLFYNAGTGALYYDVDGSGTAHKPYLIATLDAGLKLTASNFSIV